MQKNICAAQCCSLVYWCVNVYSINVYSTKEKTNKDDIVVEMKAKKTEESVLLKGVNGEQKPPNDQVKIYILNSCSKNIAVIMMR